VTLGALLGAGCGSSGVLELVFEPPEGTATVELYVSTHHPTEEPLRPDKYPLALPAVWWPRDLDPEGRDSQTVTGKSVTFAFEPGPEADRDDLNAVIAVAYDGQGAQLGVAAHLTMLRIPLDVEIDRYVIPIERVEPLPRSTAPTLPGLQQWGPDGGARACVHVDGFTGLEEFAARDAVIATPDDPDCDGLVDGDSRECVPRAFMAQKPPSRATLSCSISRATTTSDGVLAICIAGGGTCADGIGPDPDGCHPSSYCLPTGLCGTCPNLQCDGFVSNRQLITHIACTMPSVADSGGSTESFCPSAATLDLRTLFPNLSCADGAKIRDVMHPWDTSISYATGSFALEAIDPAACSYSVSADGTVPTLATGGTRREFPAMFSVPLLAPVKGRGFALPVFVTVEKNGCTTGATCVLKQAIGETMNGCLNEPVRPDELVTD